MLVRPVKHYTFIDYATQGYMALVGLIVLLLHGSAVSYWPYLVVAHALVIGLVHALIQVHARRPENRVLDFLRHFYPVLLYTGFYRETGELNHTLISGFLDPFFMRLEAGIFGLQPSLAFMDRVPHLAVSELFYAAYFSYYLMIVGVGLALFYRNRDQFFHYISIVSFVFYVCYLIYIFTPVMGPRIFFREIVDYQLPADVQPAVPPVFPAVVQAGTFYKIMAWIYHRFETPGAAFPSSHVAIAITTVWFSFLYLRGFRWVHLVVVILLCVSTVYCRYHYVVDVLAGTLTAALLIPVGNRLYFNFPETRAPTLPQPPPSAPSLT
jgi:membrane-associated phospholipid phosphatase